ncbi:MAG: hypothetical protein AAFX56_18350 [Pseudomonadota bacterium]
MKSCLITVLLLCSSIANADQEPPSDRDRILSAIRDAADYAATTLIATDGRGRIEYDLIAGRWRDYEVHWHTAQTAFGLLKAYELTGEPNYLQAATRAGDWWIATEFKAPHPFAGLVNAAHGDRLGSLINMTTITDGSNAIFELSRITGDPKYAESAVRSGDWLLENAYLPEYGLFYNIFEAETGEVWKDRSPHHPDVGPEDIKVTQVARPNSEGYLYADMCRFTGEQRYCEVFLSVADKKIDSQHPNGLWMDFEPNDPDTGKIHPRFNIWLAEAQLEAFELTGKKKYLKSALATARAMARLQDTDGTIYYRNFADGRTRKTDFTGSAVAFSGLLWLRLEAEGYSEFRDNIERSVQWLIDNQFDAYHPDANVRGAFLNTRMRRTDNGVAIYQRDIGTSFGLRFLVAYLQSEAADTTRD